MMKNKTKKKKMNPLQKEHAEDPSLHQLPPLERKGREGRGRVQLHPRRAQVVNGKLPSPRKRRREKRRQLLRRRTNQDVQEC